MSEFTRFRVQQLTPACGAELLDCNLSKFDDTLIEEVRANLRALKLPKVGGDTLFANMVAAYERLSDEIKEKIENLYASHDIARSLGKGAEELHDKYPPMVHPVVRTHPETKERLIYVNSAFTDHIVDMEPEESQQLLDTLYKTAWNPEVQCRFSWRLGSIAFWDNRSCQHFAVSDYFPEVRVMERVTIAGERP